jgi:hypothetical protein
MKFVFWASEKSDEFLHLEEFINPVLSLTWQVISEVAFCAVMKNLTSGLLSLPLLCYLLCVLADKQK